MIYEILKTHRLELLEQYGLLSVKKVGFNSLLNIVSQNHNIEVFKKVYLHGDFNINDIDECGDYPIKSMVKSNNFELLKWVLYNIRGIKKLKGELTDIALKNKNNKMYFLLLEFM